MYTSIGKVHREWQIEKIVLPFLQDSLSRLQLRRLQKSIRVQFLVSSAIFKNFIIVFKKIIFDIHILS